MNFHRGLHAQNPVATFLLGTHSHALSRHSREHFSIVIWTKYRLITNRTTVLLESLSSDVLVRRVQLGLAMRKRVEPRGTPAHARDDICNNKLALEWTQ